MARIAFCWELGRGLGHVVPHLDVIRRLARRGDDVTFLAKNAERAQAVLRELRVPVRPLPHGFTPMGRRMRNADSYPEVVFNCGFDDVDALHSRVAGIIQTVEQLEPDVIVCDFAPSVMLANAVLRRPVIAAGSGYCVPPRVAPMPRFRYWLGAAGEHAFVNETAVLANINAVLARFGAYPLERFADMLVADQEWLHTFPELDFYGDRASGNYVGLFPVGDYGEQPRWPGGDGPKVFAYLAPAATTSRALAALQALGMPVCLYAPELDEAEIRALDPDCFHVVDAPISMQTVARECDLFVNNGNLSTVSAALLAGKPQLCLPRAAEQYVNARRLELLGAGLAAPQRQPGDIAAKLRALVHEPKYARAAARFARQHVDVGESERTGRLLRSLDAVVSSGAG